MPLTYLKSCISLLALGSLAVAAPTTAGVTFTCPKGAIKYTSNFDNLPQTKGTLTYVNETTHGHGRYNGLYLGDSWYLASSGLQNYPDSQQEGLNATAHSGKNAIVTVNADPNMPISTYYSDQRIDFKSLWVRPQRAGAFPLKFSCYCYGPADPQGSKNPKHLSVSIPAKPQGQYSLVQFTSAQQKTLTACTSCTVGAENQHVLLDDLSYCFHSGV